MKIKRMILIVIMTLMLFPGDQVSANRVQDAHVTAQLVAEVQSIQPGRPFWVGLHLNMDPGWHTYWRNPGDSGLPTTLEWNLPEGYEASAIQWPYPKEFSSSSLSGYGYEGQVMLLVKMTPPSSLVSGTEQSLSANASWLSCEKICIPGSGTFELTLPISETIPEMNFEWKVQFQKAQMKLPTKNKNPSIEVTASKQTVTFRFLALDPEVQNVKFFPYSETLMEHGIAQKFLRTQADAQLTVARSALHRGNLEKVEGVLVLKGPRIDAHEIKLEVGPTGGMLTLFPLHKVAMVVFGLLLVGWLVKRGFF